MITDNNESPFDDLAFELRIEELLTRRAEEVDVSGVPLTASPTRKISLPTRVQYLAACAALALVVSSAFFLQFGRSSDQSPTTPDAADATDSDLPEPTPDDEQTPVDIIPTIETVDVRGITINADVADQLEALLAAAEADGIVLSGGGYRSSATQIERRKQNCGTTNYDIYEKPAQDCNPPTAKPGASKHEQGLAVDFSVGDELIRSTTEPGYIWLADNAPSYGMEGYDDEPWHWEFVDDVNITGVDDVPPPARETPESPDVPREPQEIPEGRERLASIPEEDLRTINGMTVHVNIAEQLQAMVDDAKEEGIELTGTGYRDPAAQLKIRENNCGTSEYDIWDKPASECMPPTARPGVSMHERALAVDFMDSNGQAINRESEEYIWLVSNAARYGLRNLPAEPWHWSTNGK